MEAALTLVLPRLWVVSSCAYPGITNAGSSVGPKTAGPSSVLTPYVSVRRS